MSEAHERIAAGIARGDAAEAKHWMRKHIVDFRRSWETAKLSLDQRVSLPSAVADAR